MIVYDTKYKCLIQNQYACPILAIPMCAMIHQSNEYVE